MGLTSLEIRVCLIILLATIGVMHEADDAYSVRSTWSWSFFLSSYYSVLECYNLLSGVEYKIILCYSNPLLHMTMPLFLPIKFK